MPLRKASLNNYFMKTNFTIVLLLFFSMPIITIAQSKQKSYAIDLSKQNKYPGGIYAEWNPVAKKYEWHSPQHESINQSKVGNTASLLNASCSRTKPASAIRQR